MIFPVCSTIQPSNSLRVLKVQVWTKFSHHTPAVGLITVNNCGDVCLFLHKTLHLATWSLEPSNIIYIWLLAATSSLSLLTVFWPCPLQGCWVDISPRLSVCLSVQSVHNFTNFRTQTEQLNTCWQVISRNNIMHAFSHFSICRKLLRKQSAANLFKCLTCLSQRYLLLLRSSWCRECFLIFSI